MVRVDSGISLEDLFPEKDVDSIQSTLAESMNPTLASEKTADLTLKLELEIQMLKDEIKKEKFKVEQHKQSQEKVTKEKDKQLKQADELLEKLQQQLISKQAHEQEFKNLSDQIVAIDYDNIDMIIINTFLFGKDQHIIDHLKAKHPVNSHFIGIPSISFTEKNDHPSITVTGIQGHHTEFKLILRRVQTLLNVTRSATNYYKRQLNSKLQVINDIMTKNIRFSQDWKYYTKYFRQLVEKKAEEFIKLYDDYISQKSKQMVNECITNADFQSQNQLRKLSTMFMKRNQFLPELEILKSEALDEYIKQHVLSERSKFEKKPSIKSLQIVSEFIERVKKDLKTNEIYVGCNLEQFKQILHLLKRIMLYYRCFLLQLPLYESSKELLDKIKENTVITLSTSTGSGK